MHPIKRIIAGVTHIGMTNSAQSGAVAAHDVPPAISACRLPGVERASEVLGRRWTILILASLVHGPHRFTDLRDSLPRLSTSVLATRLQELRDLEIVDIVELPPPMASSVYELTRMGLGIVPVLEAVERWGRELPNPGD